MQRLANEHQDSRWREVIPLYTGLATPPNARQMIEAMLVQADTRKLCNILLDALASTSVEIMQDSEFGRRVLQRALTAPFPGEGSVKIPGRLAKDELYELALEYIGTSSYNDGLSAAFSVL